jgi:hypothetical protein
LEFNCTILVRTVTKLSLESGTPRPAAVNVAFLLHLLEHGARRSHFIMIRGTELLVFKD